MNPVESLRMHADALADVTASDPAHFRAVLRYATAVRAEAQAGVGGFTPARIEAALEGFEVAFDGWVVTGVFSGQRIDSGAPPPVRHAFRIFENVRIALEVIEQLDRAKLRTLLRRTPERSRGQESRSTPATKVFIGHGRHQAWLHVRDFVERTLRLSVETFESEPRAGHHVLQVLEGMLERASFAVIVATGEDLTELGTLRARQNVIHEIGLFQGRLGFNRVVLLHQEGVEEFSNVNGLQYIPFAGDRIQATYFELENALRREGLPVRNAPPARR